LILIYDSLTFFSYGFTFRKEGHTKVIEYDLSRKQKHLHAAVKIKRPDIFHQQNIQSQSRKTTLLEQKEDAESDLDMSEPESTGNSALSENADDEDTREPSQSNQPPKSASGKTKTSRGRNERVMAPEECRAHLRRLFQNEPTICSLLFRKSGPLEATQLAGPSKVSADMFFMEVLPVTPTRFRPPAKIGETLFEHPQNELLTRILNTSYRVRDLNIDLRASSKTTDEFDDAIRRNALSVLIEALVQLQVDVNSYMDSSKNPVAIKQGKLPPAGVKQGLEKKEGLFRKHMMVW
jgi:DNA-directed RNA polymerase beta' subunit